MAVITVRDVPDELHQRLKEMAEASHRSLNAQVLSILTYAVLQSPEPVRDEAWAKHMLARVDKLKKVDTTEEEIVRFIREDRDSR